MNKTVGESHEVMLGTGVPPAMAAGDAPPDGGGGDRLTQAELAVLEEAEKAAAKRAKKAGRKARGSSAACSHSSVNHVLIVQESCKPETAIDRVLSSCVWLMCSAQMRCHVHTAERDTAPVQARDVIALHLCAALFCTLKFDLQP